MLHVFILVRKGPKWNSVNDEEEYLFVQSSESGSAIHFDIYVRVYVSHTDYKTNFSFVCSLNIYNKPRSSMQPVTWLAAGTGMCTL